MIWVNLKFAIVVRPPFQAACRMSGGVQLRQNFRGLHRRVSVSCWDFTYAACVDPLRRAVLNARRAWLSMSGLPRGRSRRPLTMARACLAGGVILYLKTRLCRVARRLPARWRRRPHCAAVCWRSVESSVSAVSTSPSSARLWMSAMSSTWVAKWRANMSAHSGRHVNVGGK